MSRGKHRLLQGCPVDSRIFNRAGWHRVLPSGPTTTSGFFPACSVGRWPFSFVAFAFGSEGQDPANGSMGKRDLT